MKKSQEEIKQAKYEADKRYREKYADKLKEKKRLYYLKNKEKISVKAAKNYLKNKEAKKKYVAEWKKANAAKVNATCMKRHAYKLKATPDWLSDDELWMIEEAYHLAKLREKVVGGKWHVDHIIPLRGKIVCGLHVPWNLQVITASENCSKRNSFEV